MRGAEGGSGSFEQLYLRSWPRLHRSLLLASGDSSLAEDLAAEAFARAYERWSSVQDMESPDAWLLRVAHNLLRSRRRRERVARRPHPSPPTEIAIPEIDPQVWEAVRALPLRARQVVALRYVHDLTQARIAEVLGLAPGTVAAALNDARTRLAGALPSPETEEVTVNEVR